MVAPLRRSSQALHNSPLTPDDAASLSKPAEQTDQLIRGSEPTQEGGAATTIADALRTPLAHRPAGIKNTLPPVPETSASWKKGMPGFVQRPPVEVTLPETGEALWVSGDAMAVACITWRDMLNAPMREGELNRVALMEGIPDRVYRKIFAAVHEAGEPSSWKPTPDDCVALYTAIDYANPSTSRAGTALRNIADESFEMIRTAQGETFGRICVSIAAMETAGADTPPAVNESIAQMVLAAPDMQQVMHLDASIVYDILNTKAFRKSGNPFALVSAFINQHRPADVSIADFLRENGLQDALDWKACPSRWRALRAAFVDPETLKGPLVSEVLNPGGPFDQRAEYKVGVVDCGVAVVTHRESEPLDVSLIIWGHDTNVQKTYDLGDRLDSRHLLCSLVSDVAIALGHLNDEPMRAWDMYHRELVLIPPGPWQNRKNSETNAHLTYSVQRLPHGTIKVYGNLFSSIAHKQFINFDIDDVVDSVIVCGDRLVLTFPQRQLIVDKSIVEEDNPKAHYVPPGTSLQSNNILVTPGFIAAVQVGSSVTCWDRIDSHRFALKHDGLHAAAMHGDLVATISVSMLKVWDAKERKLLESHSLEKDMQATDGQWTLGMDDRAIVAVEKHTGRTLRFKPEKAQ